jgi:hypothetical protein
MGGSERDKGANDQTAERGQAPAVALRTEDDRKRLAANCDIDQ